MNTNTTTDRPALSPTTDSLAARIDTLERSATRWRTVAIAMIALTGGALIGGMNRSSTNTNASNSMSTGGDVVSFSAASRTWIAGPADTVFWRIDGVELNRVK